MTDNPQIPSLIQFWRHKRRQAGLPCEIRPFHKTIANALTRLVLGRSPKPNVMILEPPRCAKTDLGVKTFVTWGLSICPDSEWILTSYGQDLATANAVDIRSTLASDWYRQTVMNGPDSYWGAHVALRGEGAGGRQDYFFTEEGGCVKAVGSGGGITGFGAGKLRPEFGGAIVIDDPLKAQDRRSPAMRQAAIDYIENTLKSRRNRQDDPPTPIVLIMQRLHPQDPAGQLLAKEREKWEIIQIPAHDEAGQTIWPGRLNYNELMEIKEADPGTYFADYMQVPSESMLTIFKNAWWQRWYDIQEVEKRITLKIITSDTAFKAKDSSDFSVLQCWGIEGISGLYLLDQVRGQWEFPELLKNARAFIAKHTIQAIGCTPASEAWVEDRASGQSLVQTLRREGINVRGWAPKDFKSEDDKISRANQCTLPISAGRVFIPDSKLLGFQWVDSFVNECSAFSAELDYLHDDQVDTMTMAILIWLSRGGGRGPIPAPFERR